MKSGRFILDRISAFHGVPASFEMTGQFYWTSDQRDLDRKMTQFPMPSLNSNGMSTRNRKRKRITTDKNYLHPIILDMQIDIDVWVRLLR